MKHQQFKTNLKCQGCVDKVSAELNTNPEIKSWSVDTNSADKVLEIETSLTEKQLKQIFEKFGFKIEHKL